MPKVFISHSTRDRDFVEREIITLLSDHGIDTWYCKDDIRTADEWERTIFKGLESCDWFLLAMSAHAAESEWVKDEVHWAIDERPGKIVPVRIGDCKPRDFHIRLGRIQYVDLLENREEGKVRLLRLWGIDRIVKVVPAPPSPPTPAAAPLAATTLSLARPQPPALGLAFAVQRRFEGHAGAITCLAISPDGRFAASGSRDASVRLWDLSGTKRSVTLAGHSKPIGSVAFFADCARILTSSADQSVRIFDVGTGREVRAFPRRTNWATVILSQHIACSGSPTDEALMVWNPLTGQEYRRLVGHTDPVRSIAHGRQTVVTSSRDQTLRIWDAEHWRLRATVAASKSWGSTIAVDAMWRRLIAGAGPTIGVWDLSSGAELARLKGHAEDVLAVAVTADGRRMVSGGVDGSVRVWDLDAGREIACGTGHEGEVNAVAITPDGVHALSAGEDRTLRLWRMPEFLRG